MFKTIELQKTWKVDKTKLPNLNDYVCIEHSLICLSSSSDSLQICVNKETSDSINRFYITMIDISGNKIAYIIDEQDYNETKTLIGKVLTKKVYIINSSYDPNKLLYLDVYIGLNVTTVNYYATSKLLLNSIQNENWFGDEIDDLSLSDVELFNKLK